MQKWVVQSRIYMRGLSKHPKLHRYPNTGIKIKIRIVCRTRKSAPIGRIFPSAHRARIQGLYLRTHGPTSLNLPIIYLDLDDKIVKVKLMWQKIFQGLQMAWPSLRGARLDVPGNGVLTESTSVPRIPSQTLSLFHFLYLYLSFLHLHLYK